MTNKTDQFIHEIKQQESFYEQEYNYAYNSGNTGFSQAKGAYRWIRNYLKDIRSIEQQCSNNDDFFNKAQEQIDNTYWDDDYPEPRAVKSMVQGMINKYHV